MGNKTSAGEVILQPSDSHTCCFELYNDGKTKCWDRSEFGLSKNEYIKQIEYGVDFTLFLLSTLHKIVLTLGDHSVYFMGAGKYFYMPTNTTKPQILQMLKKYKFKQISAGYTHALFLQGMSHDKI
jgi:alpha-tubulin suppressor-like RCC1 family protein